jgi:hypothetical protein
MGGFLDAFKSRSKTTTLEPMLTDEQKRAMSLLTQFGATGSLGDFQAGQLGDLSGFNFDMTGTEQSGQNLLNQNMNSQYLADSQNALSGMVNAKFDPTDPSNGFAAFQRQLARATQQAGDVLSRDAAITGNRFGTQQSKDRVNLAAQQSDITASKMGDLWNQTQQNKLSAASGLANIDQVIQQKAQQAYQLGGLERDLKNQQAQLKYEDWQRSRNERLSSIDALSGVMNKNVDYGLKSYTKKSPGVGMAMLGEIIPGIGSYNTHQYGYTTNQTSLSDAMKILQGMSGGIK